MTGAYAITVYGLFVALGAMAFIIATYAVVKLVLKSEAGDIARIFAIIIPAGLIGARAVYCLASPAEWLGWQNALRVWRGGLSLAGAIGFSALALRLYMGSGKAFAQAADCLTPGAMLFIAIIRMAEGTTGEGVGKGVDTYFLRGGPFVMTDVYGDIRHAVYRMEALAALVLCAVSLILIIRRVRRARTSGITWLLFFACGVLLESLRDDNYLKWDYVRISQLIYFIALLVLAGRFLVLGFKACQTLDIDLKGWALLLFIALLGGALTVFQEFRVDTDMNLELNYLIMALGLAALSSAALYCDKLAARAARRRRGERRGAVNLGWHHQP